MILQFSEYQSFPNLFIKLVTLDLTLGQLLLETSVTYTRDFYMSAGTYQVECLTIWFNFVFFHIFDKAAVGIPRKVNRSDISNMQNIDTAKFSW